MNEEIKALIEQYIKANDDHEWDKAHEIFLEIKHRQEAEELD